MTDPINPLHPLRNTRNNKQKHKGSKDPGEFSQLFANGLDEANSLESMINLYMKTPVMGSLKKLKLNSKKENQEKNNKEEEKYIKLIYQIYSKL